MFDNINLDHISTNSEYNLQTLCETDLADDEVADSPYTMINNTCTYYDPKSVKDIISDGLTLLCLNAQGLRAHWDSFSNLLYEMNDETHYFDVIGITELYSMGTGECTLPGYHPLEFIVRNNSNSSRGGVGIYVKEEYQYKLRKDLSIFIPNVFESIFIEVQYGKSNIVIGTIYRPNTFPLADLDIFMYNIQELQEILSTEHKDVFLMGDMNINILKFREHGKTADYLENVFSQGYIPLITKPTRVCGDSATLIDHLYTNKQNLVATSGIIICDISDHFGIFSSVKYQHKHMSKNPKLRPRRFFSEQNVNFFNNILQQVDFNPVFNSQDVNQSYDRFLELYLEAFEMAFPLKSINVPKKFVKQSPWITKGLTLSAITKSELLKKKHKSPTIQNITKYTNYCTIYKSLLRRAKSSYYYSEFALAKNNMKRSWSLIRSALNKQDTKEMLPNYFKHNNVIISDNKTIANKFNLFFANIGYEISQNVPQTNQHFSSYLGYPNQHSMFLDPVDRLDIIDIVSKMKAKPSIDNNNISSKLMKESISYTSEPLCHILNLSLSTGIVPDSMKIARVIPIFKNGDKSDFNNYRPISILPAFSKILEKIVAKKLMKFLENTNQFYKHQYGFRPHHTTVHPVIHLLNQIANENDKITKNITMATFIDLSKAFDTIDHKILLRKLEHMGIRGQVNTWLSSYLNRRQQYMEFSNYKSNLAFLKCGVPQGSILGPILFIVYINDICNSSKKLKLLCFADDTTCSYSSPDINTLYTIMNAELELVNIWLKANKLNLNTNKTKYMIFSPSASKLNTQNYSLTMNKIVLIEFA